jgi:hypothetical protein
MFSKGISQSFTARNGSKPRGFWHLTLCTLLSSQGSDAPDIRPYNWLSLRGNLSNLASVRVRVKSTSRRALGILVPENAPFDRSEGPGTRDCFPAETTEHVDVDVGCSDWEVVPLEAGSSAAFPNLWGDER